RDKEQPLAAQPVGQPTEEHSTCHRTGEIRARREAHIRIRELKLWTLLQGAGHRASERHFKSVENPGDAERNDDEGMEAAPEKAVEPSRDVGLDHRRNG